MALSAPATVQAGTQYGIVAYTGGSDTYVWGGSTGKPYSGGQAFTSPASPPGAWSALLNNFAFKTYVTPASTNNGQGNPASPINPAGNVRKRKCKKRHHSAAIAKKGCKKKRK